MLFPLLSSKEFCLILKAKVNFGEQAVGKILVSIQYLTHYIFSEIMMTSIDSSALLY